MIQRILSSHVLNALGFLLPQKGVDKSLHMVHDSNESLSSSTSETPYITLISSPNNNISQISGINKTNIKNKFQYKNKRGKHPKEFRRLQEENRKLPSKKIQLYRSGSERLS